MKQQCVDVIGIRSGVEKGAAFIKSMTKDGSRSEEAQGQQVGLAEPAARPEDVGSHGLLGDTHGDRHFLDTQSGPELLNDKLLFCGDRQVGGIGHSEAADFRFDQLVERRCGIKPAGLRELVELGKNFIG